MKAVVLHAAKDIRLEDHQEPQPAKGQALVRLAAGGICGSDLHYYQHGGFGTVKLREPMILGHEVSAHVIEPGDDSGRLKPGQLVSVSPSRPCNTCEYCDKGQQNQCTNMRFYGSAMPFPHIQGAFREMLAVDVAQCVPADGLSEAQAAVTEPLAVCLHASRLAGDFLGKRVLVTGCGPIGMLIIAIARAAGAREIIATDIAPFTLKKARDMGADRTINVGTDPDGLDQFATSKGTMDVLFECSGVASALASAVPALRPRSTIVQVGFGGEMLLPMQAITAKEIQLKGSFRFHEEFETAVAMMQKELIDVQPLITHSFPLADVVPAFETAADRSQAIKAQILFSENTV